MKHLYRRLILSGGCAFCALAANPALAQAPAEQSDSAAGQPASEVKGLQDIIVTAQRVETSLQRTPIAVTAVTGADLQARGAASLLDVQTFTPSLQIGSRSVQGAQQGGFTIRGMGVDAVASSPAVGIYLDEVYYPSGAGNLLGLFDVERIEVLRGPQGTLFGRNTIAGAVQYISVKPGNELTGFLEGTAGNFGRLDVSGAITIPIHDTLSLRVSAQSTNRDGFVHDDLNNIDRGSDEVRQGRVQLRWKPSDRLTVDLKVDGLRQRNNGRAIAILSINPNGQLVQLATNPFLFGPFAYTGPFDDRFVSTQKYHIAGFNGQEYFRYSYWSAESTIRYQLTNDITLKSISAFSQSKQRSLLDFDATPAPIVQGFGANPGVIKLFTQELQLSGRSFGGRLHWTGGLYYYDSKDYDSNRGFTLAMLPDAIGFQPSNGNTLIRTRAVAAYVQGTYDLTDHLSVTAGLRYSEEKVRGTNATFPRPPLTNKFTNSSPLVSINYQATPDILFYGKASRGFRAGGFAVSNALASGFSAFGPETAWTYEGGARLELFNRRIRINPTGYFTDWKNIQFNALIVGSTPNGLPTTVVATANAGDAHIWGAELESQFVATDRLMLTASGSWTDGEYTRIAPGVSLTLDSGLQRAPRFKYAVGARYTYPLANDAKVVANVEWSHTTRQRSATTDADAITLPAYGLLNARLQYAAKDNRWSVAMFGTNLTNTYYYIGGAGQSLADVLGPVQADLARPREYGVTVRVGF